MRNPRRILQLTLTILAVFLFCANTAAQAEEKRISEVRVIGIRKLSEDYVLGVLGISAQDTFREEELKEWEKKLRNLSAVKNVVIRAFPAEKKNEVRVFIVISEQATRKVSPVISRGLTNRWSFGLSYRDSDFRGRNEKAGLKGLLGGTTLFEAFWGKESSPGINRLGFLVKFRYCDYSYVFKDFSRYMLDDGIREMYGAVEISVYAVGNVKLLLSPGVDVYDLADKVFMETAADAPETPSGVFPTLEYGFEVNTLNRVSYPESGLRLKTTRKDWGILKSNSAMKSHQYRLEGTAAFRLARSILALRANSVLTGSSAPLVLLQHIGGEGTVRGYEFGSISGANSLYSSVELHIPLNFSEVNDPANPRVLTDVHLFLDSGACWSGEKELKAESFYSGFGIGMSFFSDPSTVLLVDYAWTLNSSGRWQIDIRSSF